MIDRLLRLLEGREDPAAAGSSEETLRLSVAALLVEAARRDDTFSDEERATIANLLSRHFGVSAQEASTLIRRADERVSSTVQYFPFTHNINTNMTAADKAGFIEMLWRVAYADGTLDPHEDQLIRQVAGLIHVPDRERMLARQRALKMG